MALVIVLGVSNLVRAQADSPRPETVTLKRLKKLSNAENSKRRRSHF
jgi:hypothetical protein